jgi:glycosyltransferase involved in cell wall biosynthesis
MKVALFLKRGLESESGGTYSFEKDLLISLTQFKNNTQHIFFVFGWQQEPPAEIMSSQSIRYIYLFSPAHISRKIYHKISKIELVKKLKFLGNKIFNPRLEEENIIKILQKNEIDIIWNWGLNCPVYKMPYITTVWDLQHRLQPYFPEISLKWNEEESFYRETLSRASYVITGTKVGKAEIETFYQVPSERIKVLPFATPTFSLKSHFQEKKDFLDKYNLPDSIIGKYLFYPASFLTHKNHANLLLSLRFLKDDLNLEFPVFFAGSDQGNLPYIMELSDDLGLKAQTFFLGFIPQEDLISFYRYAFALTFVSLHGPDNLPPLEAFALGCPVVASNVSGAEEQLGEAALLINAKDPKQIAFALKSLMYDSGLRQTLIQRGLARATQWTGQDYIQGVCSILDEFSEIRRCWGTYKF